MDEARSEPLWRAVRIATLAAMAAVVFGSALAITTKMWDSDLAVNTGEPEPRAFFPWIGDVYGPWDGQDEAPLGSVMVGPDAGSTQNGYIPLLGFVWWGGPISLVLFFIAGVALVHHSRDSRERYLTTDMLAGGAAAVLLGALAAIPLAQAFHL